MGKTIVIVDDEEDLCQLLELAVKNRHPQVKVHLAYDGEAGLALLRKVRPDLAVLDIKMPKLNGYEVLNEMRQDPVLKQIPVMMLTSLTEGSGKSDEAWAQSLEVEAFVSKPYEMELLLKRLEAILGLPATG